MPWSPEGREGTGRGVVTGLVCEGRVTGIGDLSVEGFGCSILVEEEGLVEVVGAWRVDDAGGVGVALAGRDEVVGRVTVEGLADDTPVPDEGLVTVVEGLVAVIEGRLVEVEEPGRMAGATCLPWSTGLVPGRVAGVFELPAERDGWREAAADEGRGAVFLEDRVEDAEDEREDVDEEERLAAVLEVAVRDVDRL